MKKIILFVLITIALVGCTEKVSALTLEEAQEIALKEVEGKILKAKEDKDDGVTYYDFTIITDTEKYEIEVDANSGKVLKREKDDDYIGTTINPVDGTVTPITPVNTAVSLEEAQKIRL